MKMDGASAQKSVHVKMNFLMEKRFPFLKIVMEMRQKVRTIF